MKVEDANFMIITSKGLRYCTGGLPLFKVSKEGKMVVQIVTLLFKSIKDYTGFDVNPAFSEDDEIPPLLSSHNNMHDMVRLPTFLISRRSLSTARG